MVARGGGGGGGPPDRRSDGRPWERDFRPDVPDDDDDDEEDDWRHLSDNFGDGGPALRWLLYHTR